MTTPCSVFSVTRTPPNIDLTQCVVTEDNGIVREAEFHLPAFLVPGVWRRHRLTFTDIVAVLQSFKPFHLWHLAMCEDIAVSNSALKISFAAPDKQIIGSKQIVLDKLKRFYQNMAWPSACRIIKPDDDHTPPLPVHRVRKKQFARMLADVKTPGRSHRVWFLLDVAWVAITAEADEFVQLIRVITPDTNQRMYGSPSCIMMMPNFVYTRSHGQLVLSDESCYVTTATPATVVTTTTAKRSRKKKKHVNKKTRKRPWANATSSTKSSPRNKRSRSR